MVRLGIGHPGRKELVAAYVLHDFAKADQDWLDDLLRGMSDGADALAKGDTGGFQNAVALRVNPPRSGTGTAGGKSSGAERSKAAKSKAATPDAIPPTASQPAPRDETPPTEEDTRSPLQKLADRFR